MGRYLSPGLIGLAGRLNTYGYTLQNPLLYTDPTGENPVVEKVIQKSLLINIYYISGEGSGSNSVRKTDAAVSLKHSLRFLSHSSKTLNNWFEVSPLCSTIKTRCWRFSLASFSLGV